jgi:hypothetical protein
VLPSCGALGLPQDYPVTALSLGARQSIALLAKVGLSSLLPAGQGSGSEMESQGAHTLHAGLWLVLSTTPRERGSK